MLLPTSLCLNATQVYRNHKHQHVGHGAFRAPVPRAPLVAKTSAYSLQVGGEELNQLGCALGGVVVEVNVRKTRDDVKLLRLLGDLHGALAEVQRVGVTTGDHEQRPGRDEVHEGKGAVRRKEFDAAPQVQVG